MPEIQEKENFNKKYGVIVVELDDVVPRRHPEKPNLFVGITTVDLETRWESLERSKRHRWLRGHIRDLRRDLCIETELESREEANTQKHSLIKRLLSEGYTVNRNVSVWTVYVIELESEKLADGEIGYVYVGETSKDPQVRFQQHIGKARNGLTRLYSPTVARLGKRLRPDLSPTEKYFDSTSSKEAEAAWAEHLRSLGYKVAGGH